MSLLRQSYTKMLLIAMDRRSDTRLTKERRGAASSEWGLELAGKATVWQRELDVRILQSSNQQHQGKP